MGQAYFAKSLKKFAYFTGFILKPLVTGSRSQAGWPGSLGSLGKAPKSINQKKIRKSENRKKFAYLAKPWKKFAYLTEFNPKLPVPDSRSQAGWPEAWAGWGSSEIKKQQQQSPKSQKPKSGRSLPIGPKSVRTLRRQAPHSSSSYFSFP